jgi:tripartite-type tricarboxylate transporter receptor subunit TctC
MDKRQFMRGMLVTAATAAASAVSSGHAADTAADTFPARPLKLVVTNPPGGAGDILGRVLSPRITELTGQSLVIENRPGLSVGTVYAAHQPADGYTLLMGAFSNILGQPLLSKVSYDVARDFRPVSFVAASPVVLVVPAASPFQNLKALLEAATARPGSLNYGCGATGSLSHLVGEMLNLAAKVQIQRVPYKGGVQAVNDVLAGQLDLVVGDPQTVLPHVQAGKLRMLAVSSEQRFPLSPEVPTFAESGLPELTALNTWGIFVPAGVADAQVERLNQVLVAAIGDARSGEGFRKFGVTPRHSSPAELRDFVASESARYRQLISERNIQAE